MTFGKEVESRLQPFGPVAENREARIASSAQPRAEMTRDVIMVQSEPANAGWSAAVFTAAVFGLRLNRLRDDSGVAVSSRGVSGLLDRVRDAGGWIGKALLPAASAARFDLRPFGVVPIVSEFSGRSLDHGFGCFSQSRIYRQVDALNASCSDSEGHLK